MQVFEDGKLPNHLSVGIAVNPNVGNICVEIAILIASYDGDVRRNAFYLSADGADKCANDLQQFAAWLRQNPGKLPPGSESQSDRGT